MRQSICASISPALEGKFISRPNRFVAIIESNEGRYLRCLLRNTGRLSGVLVRGRRVVYTPKPGGRTSCILEGVECPSHSEFAIIDTRIHEEAFFNCLKRISFISNCILVKRHYKVGGKSRIDALLECDGEPVFVEIKSALMRWPSETTASYPDAPTERGRRHIRDLIIIRQRGYGAIVVFIAALPGVHEFVPNHSIDNELVELLRIAASRGVLIKAVNFVGILEEKSFNILYNGEIPVKI